MNDTKLDPLDKLEMRYPWPGQAEFYQLAEKDYANFLNYFDLAWFSSLTSRDAIVSYAILLRQLAKNLQKQEELATFDDFLLWARLGMNYSFSEYTLRYLIRKKMYIYLVIRPIRLLLKYPVKGRPKFNPHPISIETRETLRRYKYPYYLLARIADLAETKGYQAALGFLKSFSRLTQSLEASMQGKLQKNPDVFIDRLINLVGEVPGAKPDIGKLVIKTIVEYSYLEEGTLDIPDAQEQSLEKDLEIPRYQLERILEKTYEQLRLEVDDGFDFGTLKTVGDMILFFEYKAQGHENLDEFQQSLKPPEVSFWAKIFGRSRKHSPLILDKPWRGKPNERLHLKSLLSILRSSGYQYPKYPKKEDQMHFLNMNQASLSSLFTNVYASKSGSIRDTRNWLYVNFDNASMVLSLVFTDILNHWFARNPATKVDDKVHFSASEDDFINYLVSIGFSQEAISRIQSTQRDPTKLYSTKILKRINEWYPHVNLDPDQISGSALDFPSAIIECFLIFIYLEIMDEVLFLENIGSIKVYPNDWVVIYFGLLRRWNLDVKGGDPHNFSRWEINLQTLIAIRDNYILISNKQCPSCGGMTMIMSSFCENCGNPM